MHLFTKLLMVGPARVNAIAKYSVLSLMFVRFPAQWTLLLDPTAAWDLINSKWPSPTSRCEIIPSRPALWYRTSPYADNRFLVTNTPVRVYSGISWSTFFGGKCFWEVLMIFSQTCFLTELNVAASPLGIFRTQQTIVTNPTISHSNELNLSSRSR